MTAHDPSAAGIAPYVGARPFRVGEQGHFHGRATEIRDVADRWQRHRVTLLHGPAGVGKTSLLHAGVVPHLRASGLHTAPVGHPVHRPACPIGALPDQNPYVFALLSSWYPDESPSRVWGLSLLDYLRGRAQTDRFGLLPRQLFAIDQAELLLRAAGPWLRHRELLFDELGNMLECFPAHLLIVVRDDRLEEIRPLVDRLAARLRDGTADPDGYALAPFDRAAAVEAVDGPLQRSGHSVPAGSAARLVDELRTVREPWAQRSRTTSAVDPALLQVACARLWGETLTDAAARADAGPASGPGSPSGPGAPPGPSAGEITDTERLTDDVDRGLAEFCAQALATVAADHRRPVREILVWFRAAFAPEQGGTGVSEDSGAAQAVPAAVLWALEDRHVLRARLDSGERRYHLHPRLIQAVHRIGDRPAPAQRPAPPARLRFAELAIAEGDFDLASYHVSAAVRGCGKEDLRLLAEAECLRGDIACVRGAPDGAEHYRESARLYEALGDTPAVGRLLVTLGRLKLAADATEAVRDLRAAAGRLPNDAAVQTGLGLALWADGQIRASLAVLDAVLSRHGDTTEALRTRGEILADLGHAEPSLRDLRRIDHNARFSTRAAWALAHAMCVDASGGPWGATEAHPDGEPAGARLGPPDPADADNGPVLLRLARVERLDGDESAAAALAARAVAAEHPPLPPQLRDQAKRLIRREALHIPAKQR
ncbi:nSTAND1 domain-containing NTPase [Actinomadura sp. 3N407]|uniref:ATP-binding protein n=1 Tax=Actinomadura sp. 3N407 TaxID=3457423 RepID=UPI003FCCAA91